MNIAIKDIGSLVKINLHLLNEARDLSPEIESIRLHQLIYGSGLAEAKQIVESLEGKIGMIIDVRPLNSYKEAACFKHNTRYSVGYSRSWIETIKNTKVCEILVLDKCYPLCENSLQNLRRNE